MRPRIMAATALACASLVAVFPAASRAQTTTTTPGTTAPAHVRALVYGRITELAGDHITIKPANGNARRLRLLDATRYVALSLAAAREGLHEGDYASAIGVPDTNSPSAATNVAPLEVEGTATRITFSKQPFGHAANVTMVAAVVSSGFNSLTVRSASGDVVTVHYTQNTRFYINAKLVQNPPTFRAGETVHLFLHRETDDTLNALRVTVHRI